MKRAKRGLLGHLPAPVPAAAPSSAHAGRGWWCTAAGPQARGETSH